MRKGSCIGECLHPGLLRFHLRLSLKVSFLKPIQIIQVLMCALVKDEILYWYLSNSSGTIDWEAAYSSDTCHRKLVQSKDGISDEIKVRLEK